MPRVSTALPPKAVFEVKETVFVLSTGELAPTNWSDSGFAVFVVAMMEMFWSPVGLETMPLSVTVNASPQEADHQRVILHHVRRIDTRAIGRAGEEVRLGGDGVDVDLAADDRDGVVGADRLRNEDVLDVVDRVHAHDVRRVFRRVEAVAPECRCRNRRRDSSGCRGSSRPVRGR